MNKMLFVLAVAFAALTGCATTTTARPAVSDPPPPAFMPPSGPQYAMPPGTAAAMPVPPARPESMMGPPQNWAWLHTPPYGCERGPNALMIANDTEYFMRIVLDGEDLIVRGAAGVFPEIPPHAAAYVCLAHLEEHTISGVAYTLRYGVAQEMPGPNGRFNITRRYGAVVRASGRHELHINRGLLLE
ncbi:MAG TPA: hypothetical protein VLC10_04035 [Patescibacteria group bacterium]|nr:hypothetical protein [Patescibacteria group bacterium]